MYKKYYLWAFQWLRWNYVIRTSKAKTTKETIFTAIFNAIFVAKFDKSLACNLHSYKKEALTESFPQKVQ